MLKYVDVAVTFAEVPDEISLCINISNCPCHCENCHSSYLAEDIGNILDKKSLDYLLTKFNGISCVSFMGGDKDPLSINILAKYIKNKYNLKVCWYSGKQEISNYIELKWFDYIKIGPYISQNGPLNNSHTNQKFYRIVNNKIIDITYKFRKHD